MPHKITHDCISCGMCEPECPFEAIEAGTHKYHIDPTICEDCGICVEGCPADAIHPID